MRTARTVLTLLVAIFATVPLAAQERRAILVERIQELNLTDEQEAKIAEIQKAGRPKVEAAAKELAAVAKEEERFPGWAAEPALRDPDLDAYAERQCLERGLADRILCGSSFVATALANDGKTDRRSR